MNIDNKFQFTFETTSESIVSKMLKSFGIAICIIFSCSFINAERAVIDIGGCGPGFEGICSSLFRSLLTRVFVFFFQIPCAKYTKFKSSLIRRTEVRALFDSNVDRTTRWTWNSPQISREVT
jgi:hypothetical protein